MALNATNPNFPAPYVNKTEAEDAMMKRVPFNRMDYGATASGMPKDANGLAALDHVSNRST